jgi:hypothetical protein
MILHLWRFHTGFTRAMFHAWHRTLLCYSCVTCRALIFSSRLQRPMGWVGLQSLLESVAIGFKIFLQPDPFRMHLRSIISSPLRLPVNYLRVTMSGYRDSTTLGRSSASSIELLHHAQAQTTFRLVRLAPIEHFATEV